MSGEPDSGTGAGGFNLKLEPPIIINNNNNEDIECDIEKVSASHASNYDSLDANTILKCDRCNSFETISRALFIVHIAQCNVSRRTSDVTDGGGSGGAGSSTEADPAAASLLVVRTSSADTVKSENPQQQQPHHRKLFECDVCNMKFSNGANMRRHKMRHTGVKPYECRVCQKRFFRKDHLAEHFTTHTKTLPYHCPICNRGFQRQIAMRAHFQNEHVGQHELVKTCPLCSYRAGTMKSLRVHFYNRHGIDLDNPGPNAPSSLLMALDPQNASNYLPSSIAAAVAAAAASGANQQPSYSDSGDSLRSADNGTPPMHFLTPHVEISMADDSFKTEIDHPNVSSALEIKPCGTNTRPNGTTSPQSADSNSNAPTSSQSLIGNVLHSSRHLLVDGQITPSISLIPIKQEPSSDDYHDSSKSHRQNDQQLPAAPQQSSSPNTNVTNSSSDNATPSSSLMSLIKVSPLKSLLREDLKRRITARANRPSRNSSQHQQNQQQQQQQHHMSNSMTVTTETAQSVSSAMAAVVAAAAAAANNCPSATATTSNGAITSTGPDAEMRKRMLQCLFCGIEFPDQTLYFLHKGCHSESNPWKCNICGEQLNNVYEFNSHLLSKSHQ